MPTRILRLQRPAPERVDPSFERIRAQFDIRTAFPPPVVDAARQAAARPLDTSGRTDLRALEFFTVDPPESLDLDQAMLLERRTGGFRVHYAIADVAVFVERGGVIEAEAWLRGQTAYCPDERLPLYPTEISEGAASLLPDCDRPAIVFTIDLDASGATTAMHVERAVVRSRAKLDYATVEGLRAELLREIGELRHELELARGGVQLQTPEQTVVASGNTFELQLAERLPSEDWNAQISLLTGMAAAELMLRRNVGLLRTMDGIDSYRLGKLRRSAAALGVAWPRTMPYPDFIRSLDPADPHGAALLTEARGVMGHAGYAAFDGAPPPQPFHAAIAARYAHTTAPMRRLADRYVLDLLTELDAGRRPSPAEVETLEKLPEVMADTGARIGQLEGAIIDDVEVRMLAHRVGDEFAAVVTDLDNRGAHIWITDPPVKARLHADPLPPAGERVTVRLERADELSRSLQFAAV